MLANILERIRKSRAREIWLCGEAYFRVRRQRNTARRDRLRQFVVHTDELDVEVLGTVFDVYQRRQTTTHNWDGPDFVTSVVQGNEIIDMDDPASVARQHYIITTERYSYVRCNNGEEELYDKVQDPHEWDNLAYKADYQFIKQQMEAKLEERIAY